MENIELTAKERAYMQISAIIRKWVNDTLRTDIQCIEELCSGAIYCQLLDRIYENVVPLRAVIFATNAISDFRMNFVLLQELLYDMQIPIEIPIEDLVWCDFEANLKFAATFYKYFRLLTTRNPHCRQSYDPLAARNYRIFSMAPPTFVSRGTDAPNVVELAFAGMPNIDDYEDIKDVLELKDYMNSKRVKDIEGVDDMDMEMDIKDLKDYMNSKRVKDMKDDEDVKDIEGVDDMDMEDTKDVEDLDDSNDDDKIEDSVHGEAKDYGRRLNSESYVIP